MQPLHFDQINPVTGTLFTFGDANLRFVNGIGMFLEKGDPGYVPYPNETPVPVKKKKPFRRRAKSQTATEPEPIAFNTMSTFKYNTRQNPQGGFTTRVVLGEPVTDAALLGLISGTANTTPQIAEDVIRALATHVKACSAGCAYTRNFLGVLGFQPTSGGSAESPDGFHNAADINADIAISLLRESIDGWQGTLTLEHMGELGKVTPVIDSLINQATGALNIYTAGDLMQARGNNLKFNRANPLEGIFLTNAAGVETRCTVYADIEPLTFTFLIPPGTTGAQTVRMCAFISGSLRTFTYNAQITTV